MEARAIAKYVRMSPMKVGVVLDLIRGITLFYIVNISRND